MGDSAQDAHEKKFGTAYISKKITEDHSQYFDYYIHSLRTGIDS